MFKFHTFQESLLAKVHVSRSTIIHNGSDIALISQVLFVS